MKKADFYQIKQKKLTKIVIKKPKINQKILGHYKLLLFRHSKIHEK
jgi:hypothetical protein